jgi:hypothetical protein
MEREARIPENGLPALPDGLELDGDGLVLPVDEFDRLDHALAAAPFILRYLGGSVTFAAIRREVKPGSGIYETTEYVMRWNSFVPAVKGEAAEPVAA